MGCCKYGYQTHTLADAIGTFILMWIFLIGPIFAFIFDQAYFPNTYSMVPGIIFYILSSAYWFGMWYIGLGRDWWD
jgi:hypothetical protein